MENQDATFYALAKRYGHSIEALQAGQEVRSSITVNNVEELKALFDDGASPELRANRLQEIFKTFPAAADPNADVVHGLLHRVEAYVFGDSTLSPKDLEHLKTAFPLKVTAISLVDKSLNPNEQWNLDDLGADHVLVNLGTLTMAPGSSIIIHNRTLVFTVTTVVRNSDPSDPGPGYDMAILGATGDTGAAGGVGPSGPAGGAGKDGWCYLQTEAGGGGETGATGKSGLTGYTGHTGGDGKPSLTATITITGGLTGNAGHFILYTRSGTGGQGGPGGTGGTGGNGGKGGDGVQCDCSTAGPGVGGAGGTAGRGGTGGAGGNGTNGSLIFVNVPHGLGNSIIPVPPIPAPPGYGGPGGQPGNQGLGGSGGAKTKNDSNNGAVGGTGAPSIIGNTGASGTLSGNPSPIHINDN